MGHTFKEKVSHFVYAFILEQIIVMIYWMIIVKLGAEYIESMDIVLCGVAKSTAVLFIIKLVADVLHNAWDSHPERHNWRIRGMLLLALWFAGLGISYAGWTVFSFLTDTPASSRAMALLCVMSTVSILVMNRVVESLLGMRTGTSALLNALRERMDGDYDDGDIDI